MFQIDPAFHFCYGAVTQFTFCSIFSQPSLHHFFVSYWGFPTWLNKILNHAPPFLLSMFVECVCISVMAWLALLGMGIKKQTSPGKFPVLHNAAAIVLEHKSALGSSLFCIGGFPHCWIKHSIMPYHPVLFLCVHPNILQHEILKTISRCLGPNCLKQVCFHGLCKGSVRKAVNGSSGLR